MANCSEMAITVFPVPHGSSIFCVTLPLIQGLEYNFFPLNMGGFVTVLTNRI